MTVTEMHSCSVLCLFPQPLCCLQCPVSEGPVFLGRGAAAWMCTCFVGDILAVSPFSRGTGVTALMVSSKEIPSFTEVLILDSWMLTKCPVRIGVNAVQTDGAGCWGVGGGTPIPDHSVAWGHPGIA